jgi:hypothetical protein
MIVNAGHLLRVKRHPTDVAGNELDGRRGTLIAEVLRILRARNE